MKIGLKTQMIGGAILAPFLVIVVAGLYWKVVNFLLKFVFPCEKLYTDEGELITQFCTGASVASTFVTITTVVLVIAVIFFLLDQQ